MSRRAPSRRGSGATGVVRDHDAPAFLAASGGSPASEDPCRFASERFPPGRKPRRGPQPCARAPVPRAHEIDGPLTLALFSPPGGAPALVPRVGPPVRRRRRANRDPTNSLRRFRRGAGWSRSVVLGGQPRRRSSAIIAGLNPRTPKLLDHADGWWRLAPIHPRGPESSGLGGWPTYQFGSSGTGREGGPTSSRPRLTPRCTGRHTRHPEVYSPSRSPSNVIGAAGGVVRGR